MNNFVLDACAILALVNEEKNSEQIANLWLLAMQNQVNLLMHRVNLLEVYYITIKHKGEEHANVLLDKILFESPIKIIDDLAKNFKFIASLKSKFKIPIADAIAVSTAWLYNAQLITSDHKDLEPIEKTGAIQFFWFR